MTFLSTLPDHPAKPFANRHTQYHHTFESHHHATTPRRPTRQAGGRSAQENEDADLDQPTNRRTGQRAAHVSSRENVDQAVRARPFVKRKSRDPVGTKSWADLMTTPVPIVVLMVYFTTHLDLHKNLRCTERALQSAHGEDRGLCQSHSQAGGIAWPSHQAHILRAKRAGREGERERESKYSK